MFNENIIMDSTEIVSWMLSIISVFVGFYLGYRWVKKKREKGESLGGSKEEWIKAIITIAGIAIVPMIILNDQF
jgi:TRAP-type C4-dicarboxylate transport system permease small subunit